MLARTHTNRVQRVKLMVHFWVGLLFTVFAFVRNALIERPNVYVVLFAPYIPGWPPDSVAVLTLIFLERTVPKTRVIVDILLVMLAPTYRSSPPHPAPNPWRKSRLKSSCEQTPHRELEQAAWRQVGAIDHKGVEASLSEIGIGSGIQVHQMSRAVEDRRAG